MAAVGQPLPPGSNMTNTALLPIRQFLAGQPKAQGIVQIMIGLVTFMFGIVLVCHYAPASVMSGYVFWGSISYIITGSLSVAAENKFHPCLVRGSLGMNVVSAISSAAGIGLLATDFVLGYYCSDCYPNYYCNSSYCYMFYSQSHAISGVLLVLAILQFIISICLSVFACRASCCCSEPMMPIAAYSNQVVTVTSQAPVTFVNHAVNPNPQLTILNVIQNPEMHVPVVSSYPAQQPQPGVSTMNAVAMSSASMESPPAHCEKRQPDN